jgi:hypothetical protein
MRRNVHFDRYMKDGAHAGPHDFRVIGIHAVRTQQAAIAAKPAEAAQDGPEVARILNLMQINRAFPGLRRRRLGPAPGRRCGRTPGVACPAWVDLPDLAPPDRIARPSSARAGTRSWPSCAVSTCGPPPCASRCGSPLAVGGAGPRSCPCRPVTTSTSGWSPPTATTATPSSLRVPTRPRTW